MRPVILREGSATRPCASFLQCLAIGHLPAPTTRQSIIRIRWVRDRCAESSLLRVIIFIHNDTVVTVPLIEKLQSTNTKQVWYADDATAGGTLLNLKAWWTMLSSSGPSYVNPGKTWLVVKSQHEHDAKELFSGTGIGITSEGKRHLGAALGSRSFLESYMHQ